MHRALSTGCSLPQRLAWSRLLLKRVRSLPCTNTGPSLAPPKYTKSWRQSWPQYRLLGLCLLLLQELSFMPCWQRGSKRHAGGFFLLLLHQGPAHCHGPHLCHTTMLCPLCPWPAPLCNPTPLPPCHPQPLTKCGSAAAGLDAQPVSGR